MARYIGDKKSEAAFRAARHWVDCCLIDDGSALSDHALWTAPHLHELVTHFVDQPDAGKGTFYQKLRMQLEGASPQAHRLMAEVLWVLFIFPSNISTDTKRKGILEVWSWSGEDLHPDHVMLSDVTLQGIGSGGVAINNHRWRELSYIIGLAQVVQQMKTDDREQPFSSYDNFMHWIADVPMQGYRQFRHMLRYLLFPDRVERMSSNSDRRKVLRAFGLGNKRELKQLDDLELDTKLLELREQLIEKYGTRELDFYRPPLRDVWKAEAESDDAASEEVGEQEDDATEVGDEADHAGSKERVRNLILYGPPGTGKTYALQNLRNHYTDLPADVDRTTWEREIIADFGWRAVIVAALADIGAAARVGELFAHPLIEAKAIERERQKNVRNTLWGYLQQHADPSSDTVDTAMRREPFVFRKNTDSQWSLVEDWKEKESAAAELLAAWGDGPGEGRKPIERYRMVTFHPSYSYEDFVIGLRPVQDDPEVDGGTTSFRLVPGVFAQICALAKANPAHRYALFIDEINRADIAKVFGELITLIEPDKRARYDSRGRFIEGIEVQLPGTSSDAPRFGVPSNLDIYGTMNTADRSIALLDIALRRRFHFEELTPQYSLIDRHVEGVHLGRLLEAINRRLEYLRDRDHQIGHAYLMKVASLSDLQQSFSRQVVPLLQEYFFDDWSRVELVLAARNGGSPFVSVYRDRSQALFGRPMPDETEQGRARYEITSPQSWTPDAFRSIYESASDATEGVQ